MYKYFDFILLFIYYIPAYLRRFLNRKHISIEMLNLFECPIFQFEWYKILNAQLKPPWYCNIKHVVLFPLYTLIDSSITHKTKFAIRIRRTTFSICLGVNTVYKQNWIQYPVRVRCTKNGYSITSSLWRNCLLKTLSDALFHTWGRTLVFVLKLCW